MPVGLHLSAVDSSVVNSNKRPGLDTWSLYKLIYLLTGNYILM
jgi:hypothetical protein